MPRSREPRLSRGGRWLGIVVVALGLASPAGGILFAQDGWETARDAFRQAVAAKDADAALEALENFGLHDRPEAADLLIELGLTHPDIDVYRETERLLRALKSEDAREAVIDAAKDHKSWQLRADCTRILSFFHDEAAYQALVLLLEDRRWLVRSEAIRGLSQVREKRVVKKLIDRMPEEGGRLLDDLAQALRKLTGQDLPAEPGRWQSWWDAVGKDQDLPSEDGEDSETEHKKLGTAVKQGLYGTVVSERVVFVIDASGSMTAGTDLEGSRFDIATRELVRVLETQVNPKSQFNVIAFEDEIARFKPKLSKGRGSNVKKAIEFVGRLKAGGETNAYGALERAFEDSEVDTIYLLSDGSPTVGDETIPALIRRAVDEWNRYRGVKIHCIGFFPGEARNQDKAEARTFLMDLSRENRGRYSEID